MGYSPVGVSMGICKDCQYWVGSPELRNRLFLSSHGERRCTKILHLYERKDGDMAFVLDHEEYEAGLYTNPEFGCNHFERRVGW